MRIEDIYRDLPLLETDRLILRKLKRDDVLDLFAYASRSEVSKYVTWDSHRSVRDSKNFIGYILNLYREHRVAPWGIEDKKTRRLIGTVDFVWWKPDQGTAEIGYVLSPEYWGRGIMTEAVKKLIEFGFERMRLIRIQARCFAENKASARVMEKAGMTFEGTLRKAIYAKGRHWDLKVYSILKEEYFLNDSNTKSQTTRKR
ncbi:alanine acetyltransferase [Weizmannia acidilactici]|uniref:Alanine acetyltransferase n=1 Tax=Weizmannia acidilactici TaxID=2607726 RepID=A0A5J4JD68_9BACI|nr:GNAT family protein [Weizmannia acidilactici]GER65853.1 alanine acetyltransferase [Weizmannia acidilactici]GER69963.1 alanine acetyltransferase [Weizmannia acidilactici]GER73104.1 alanine acetyltransferase [Weizmannia acidilactici]